MTTTTSLYETCQTLFEQYPLAVSTDASGQAMILMLADSDKPAIYILDNYSGRAGYYTLSKWGGAVIGEIELGNEPPAASVAAAVLTRGIPLREETRS